MRIGPIRKSAKALMLAVAVSLAAPAPAGAETAASLAVTAFYERTVALSADARCGLFAEEVRAALSASERQARGAALRAGASADGLRTTAALASERVARVPCGHADLRLIQGRVAHAFAGWTRLPRMDFPGVRAAWRADRVRREAPSWELAQGSIVGASPVTFGYVGDELKTVVSFVGRSRPIAARVVLRDPDRAPRAWVTDQASLPPQALTRSVWSMGWTAAPRSLLASDRRQGEVWIFPAELGATLEALDPREIFTVEFVFRDDSVARVVFEVGDFAAGRAFLALGTV